MHVVRQHKITTKKYYDQYLKTDNENICSLCKIQEPRWKGIKEGYHILCEKCGRSKSLDVFKILYGDIIGEERFNSKVKNAGRDLNFYIKKYGEEKGTGKFNEIYIGKSSLDWYIKKYGENVGKEKYKKTCLTKGVTEEKFIKKYGEELGKIKFNLWKKNCAPNLENLIKKYGEEEGTRKFKENNSKKALSLENFIKKYGETTGTEKYFECKEKSRAVRGCTSKQSLKVFVPLIDWLIEKDFSLEEIYVGGYKERKEWFLSTGKNRIYYCYDFCIHKYKIIIEFHGEHIHPNPIWLIFDKEKWDKWRHCWTNENAIECRIKDLMKKQFAEKKGFSVLEIWSKNGIDNNIKLCKDFIDEKIKGYLESTS